MEPYGSMRFHIWNHMVPYKNHMVPYEYDRVPYDSMYGNDMKLSYETICSMHGITWKPYEFGLGNDYKGIGNFRANMSIYF